MSKNIDINALEIQSIQSVTINENNKLEIDLTSVDVNRLLEVLIGNFGFDTLIQMLNDRLEE